MAVCHHIKVVWDRCGGVVKMLCVKKDTFNHIIYKWAEKGLVFLFRDIGMEK